MSSWLNESSLVRNLAQNILLAKKSYYQEDYIKYKLLECNTFTSKNTFLQNRFQERIKATVFSPQEEPYACVVYLHGFGSHRLEGTTILSHLPKGYALCCFDFSGSGKSEGECSTYGIKEYLDIECVLKMLRDEHGYRRIVLWGRSMGAVASLLYTSLCNKAEPEFQILFQVLDSPFSSFESIAKHHANVSYHLPEMFVGFGLDILKEHFANHEFNPFRIKLEDVVGECKVPALFVYSEDDAIIPSQNSIEIISKFNTRTLYQKLIIPENHNSFRSDETLGRIFEIVRKYAVNEKIKQKVKHKKGLVEVCSSTPKEGKQIRFKKLCGSQRIEADPKKRKIKSRSNPEESSTELLKSYSCFGNCTKINEEIL